jgi:hypothetical protein
MGNSDHTSESLETIFGVKMLKFFDGDPEWKKFGSGMGKIRIWDKHPGSAKLKTSTVTKRTGVQKRQLVKI